MRTLPWLGKLLLRLIPIAVLLWGCALVPRPSPYQVIIPLLQSPPLTIPCHVPEPTTCTVVRTSDWEAVIRELKAACLANGQEPKACQAE